jgi:hypothetical protein
LLFLFHPLPVIFGLAILAGLVHLRSLDLSLVHVTNDGLQHLKGLTQLQELDLWATGITDSELVSLKGMTHLKSLNLGARRISDIGLESLKNLTELRSLDLRGSYVTVTEKGVESLQKAIPKCSIQFGEPMRSGKIATHATHVSSGTRWPDGLQKPASKH